jgi:hypothetical protein
LSASDLSNRIVRTHFLPSGNAGGSITFFLPFPFLTSIADNASDPCLFFFVLQSCTNDIFPKLGSKGNARFALCEKY